MKALRRGARGDDVVRWQTFLRGQEFDAVFESVEADGDFGPVTERATRAFQQRHGLKPDGVVGNLTYAKAMEHGLDLVEEPSLDENGPNWPARPTNLEPLITNDDRMRLFGRFAFVAAPRPGNPEAIEITDDWERKNIVKVRIPQLVGVEDAPRDGTVRFHDTVASGVVALFQAWQDAGLIDRVRSWAGSYTARYVRGSRSLLSNHAFGSAFDINVRWNRLGAQPALKGAEGSVRELVALANQHGFYWGGHYPRRPDGMHFEYARRR